MAISPTDLSVPQHPRIPEGEILFVIGSLDVGGSERHLASIAPRLRERGWQVSIYCLSHRGALADHVEAQGVSVLGTPRAPSTPALLRRLNFVMSCLRLFWLLLRRRTAIVHFFLPMAYIVGGSLSILTCCHTRIMSRRSLNRYQGKRRVLTRLELRLHRWMHAIVGNSNAVMNDLLSEGCDPERLVRIYNGIDIEAFDSTQGTKHGPETKETNSMSIVIIANLIPYKGHADLFHALAAISAALPPAWTLFCAGRDDGIGIALHQLARTLGLESHIHLLGERQDIATILASADIGVLCSHEEGFSNAVLEGMAAGLPMVVTDVGGNAEAVVDTETGFVVPSRDPDALGHAILRLALDADMRQRMGVKARDRAKQHFSLTRCIAEYDSLYRSLRESEFLGTSFH